MLIKTLQTRGFATLYEFDKAVNDFSSQEGIFVESIEFYGSGVGGESLGGNLYCVMRYEKIG